MGDDFERPRRFDAYYYGFDATGVDAVDGILSAVAWAGKRYHLTEDWTEVDDGWSERDRIQLAANDAALIFRAAELRALRHALSIAVAERRRSEERGAYPEANTANKIAERLEKLILAAEKAEPDNA